jgi:hypothetical protein
VQSGAAKGSGRIPARSGLDPGPIAFRSHFAALQPEGALAEASAPRQGTIPSEVRYFLPSSGRSPWRSGPAPCRPRASPQQQRPRGRRDLGQGGRQLANLRQVGRSERGVTDSGPRLHREKVLAVQYGPDWFRRSARGCAGARQCSPSRSSAPARRHPGPGPAKHPERPPARGPGTGAAVVYRVGRHAKGKEMTAIATSTLAESPYEQR